MKLVITGGCGFLGRLIAEQAIKRGDDVTLFDIATPPDGLGALPRLFMISCRVLTRLFTWLRW